MAWADSALLPPARVLRRSHRPTAFRWHRYARMVRDLGSVRHASCNKLSGDVTALGDATNGLGQDGWNLAKLTEPAYVSEKRLQNLGVENEYVR